jgi:RimJ/RimL family protein N-acetyltransferase
MDSSPLLQPPGVPLSDGVVTVVAVDERDRADLESAASVADIVRYFGAPPAREDVLEFFQWRWSEGVAAAFAIRIAVDSVGVVLLEPRSPGVADIGYWLLPQHRGRGYAARATRLVAVWAVREVGFSRVQLWAAPENEASQHVAMSSGFTYEGRLRSFGVEPDGTRVDALFYSLVADDLFEPGDSSAARG